MTNGQRKMYLFLKSHKGREPFTSKMLEVHTGYKHSTIDTYIRKKLINYYIDKKGADEYTTTDKLNNEGEKQFEEHMCQTHPKCKI